MPKCRISDEVIYRLFFMVFETVIFDEVSESQFFLFEVVVFR
jgi:hypothetical protein